MATSQLRSSFRNSWQGRRNPHGEASFLELIEANGGVVRAGAVAKRLGVPPEMVEQLRLAGQVLAVPLQNGYGYPVWQFEGRGFLPGFRSTLRALDGDDRWQHAIFFLTPSSRLAGQRPLDVLRDGNQQAVVDALRGLS